MQRVGSARTRAVLLFAASAAVAPILAATAPAFAGVTIRNIKPGQSAPGTSAASFGAGAAAPIIALPLHSPPINGFQPFVVYGLTDENENDFFSPGRDGVPAGTTHVPNPPRYFIATFDTGATVNILSHQDATAINLFAAGLEGTNSIPVEGAGGPSNTEDLDVSDALGLYITGLANATATPNGASVPAESLKGMWNTSILTAREGSVIPSLIGAPMTGHHQVRMLNSQTQRIAVSGTTYQGPQVVLTPHGTPIDSSFVRTELTPAYPGGANSSPAFVPDFFAADDWSDDPLQPTFYNGLIASVDVTHTGGTLVEREFLFDTGAQVTVLSESVANGVGISTGGSNPTPIDFTVEVLGVGGIRTVNGYYIQKLKLVTSGGPMEWTNVPILVTNLPDVRDGQGFIPGILGMNLFNDRDMVVNADLDDPYFAFSQTPFEARWIANAGGNWGDNSKWMFGVPWQPGAPANFTASTAAPQTINVEADYTLGTLKFDNANPYTIAGPGKLRVEQIIGAAAIEVVAGSHTISTPLELASNTTFIVPHAASVLTVSNNLTAVSNVDVTKTGQGTVELKNLRNAGDVNIQAGKVKMLPGGGSDRTSSVDTITVAAAAQVDLSDNNLVVRGSHAGSWDGANYTGVQGLVRAGRNGGAWNGAGGIITSMPAASGLTTLAVARADATITFGAAGTALWSGQTVSADDVLVMYTYAGDANLDGFISGDDYTAIDFAITTAGADGWINGDFNYDGFISGDDYTIIDFNIVAQGAPFPTAQALSITAVPEPTACLVAASLATPLLLRRRRR